MSCVAIAYIPLKKQIPTNAKAKIKEDSINNKMLAIHKLDSVFNNGRFGKIICTLYHDFNPKYELLSLSKKSKIDKKNELFQLYLFEPEGLINWDNSLSSLCANLRIENLHRGIDSDMALNGGGFYGIWQSGWALGCAELISSDKYICYLVIPYMVGYFRHNDFFYDDSFYFEFRPTIREALNTAFNFYTKNEKSQFVNFMGNDHLNYFMSLVNDFSLPINVTAVPLNFQRS